MEIYKGKPVFYGQSRQSWRDWLQAHHKTEKSVWLIIYKKESGVPTVFYPEAVEEALCFGWIDSTPNKRDAQSYYQFFAKRNPKSNWSSVNKNKVEKLISQNLMTKAGMEMIDIAKQNGTWTALDELEQAILPEDLLLQFGQNTVAYTNWQNFSKSSRRGILEWLINAKQPHTRQKRINEIVNLASENKKANQYKQ
ncbi:MAG: YdeI/OmpD-associated family protein [Cytophagales bacterium]|nr:YdeI/OmpD-associated family protein [Cytophagales bacterium]